MAEYQKEGRRFNLVGMILTGASDALPAGYFPYIRNLRSFAQDQIEPRPGLTLIADIDGAASDAIHSIRRLNDPVSSTYSRIIGAGTKLYAGTTVFTQIDTGYSGKPLSLIPHRPNRSPRPWMYIADENKLKKFKVGASAPVNMGIAAPNVSASVALLSRNYKTIDAMEAIAGWGVGGTAGAVALVAGRRVDTTIAQILYDTGTTGWACVNPTALNAQFQAGMLLLVNSGGGAEETVLVEDVFNAITSTTISSIQYDSGTSGLCTIQLTAPCPELRRDSMVRIAATENVRVLSVTVGPVGVTSFRCSTTATRSAADAVAGLASFRAYYANNHAAAETLRAEAFESAVTTGIGYLEKTSAQDLSLVNNRPVSDDDIIFFSIRVSNPASVKEIKVQFDVDSTTNDCAHNWYEYTVSPSDLTAAAQNTNTLLTTQQQVITRRQIRDTFSRLDGGRESLPLSLDDNDFGERSDVSTSEDSFDPATSAWTALRIPRGKFVRYGTDSSRTWANVALVRITINASANVTFQCDSLLIGGTYGVTGRVNYRYTYYSRETGVESNPSPPLREPLDATQMRITCTPTVSSDAQVDEVRWYRRDDSILEEYHFVGAQGNSGGFTDEVSAEVALFTPIRLRFDRLQPFPKIDTPRSGTCDVKGTEVTAISGGSNDVFNTACRAGTIIKINGVNYSFYNQPSTTLKVSLNENAGTQSTVNWEIAEPVLLGQAVPAMFGPYGGGEVGIFFFGVEDGTLKWTNPNDPDSASFRNRLEITSPSEPLINGCIYDGRPYVWSPERMFEVYFEGESFIAREVAHSKGLYGRWAFDVGEDGTIYYLAEDGIYASNGGEAVLVTADIAPLFPRNGASGVTVNIVKAIGYATPNNLRLSCANGYLYFDHLADDASTQNLVLCTLPNKQGWVLDDYTPDARLHYAEEGDTNLGVLVGSVDGKLYTMGGDVDDSTGIGCRIDLPYLDGNAFRSLKQYGDAVLDLDADGAVVAVIPQFEYASTSSTSLLATSGRDQQTISLANTIARNWAMSISFTTASGKTPSLFGWEASYLLRSDISLTRPTDWDDVGIQGAKWFQGLRIRCNSFGVDKVVEVRYDGNNLGDTLTLNADGEKILEFSFDTPFIANLARLVPLGTGEWEYLAHEFTVEPEPPLVLDYIVQPAANAQAGYRHWPEVEVALRSTATVTMTLVIDGVSYPYPIASTSGAFLKRRFRLQAIKGKVIQPKFTSSAGFRLYLKDSILFEKLWGSQGPNQATHPFGEIHNQIGARI